MKKICRILVLSSIAVLLLLATAPIGSAQPAGPFYVGVFGGFVMPDDLRFEREYDDDWDHHHDEGFDENLDESWAAGIKIGYIIPQVKFLAVELEYTYLADQDYGDKYYTGYGNQKYSYDGDFRAHNLMANLLFRYPHGKIHPYVGFGLGLSRATIEERDKWEYNGQVASENIDKDDTAFASQFIAGVNFEIMPNLSADLAYKYFYSEYEIGLFGEDFNVEAKNHLFTIGINYHF
jgi:opacity protein-like surface antigen